MVMTLLAQLRLLALAMMLVGMMGSAPALAQKLGPDGAALLWDGDILRATSYPVSPIDTTGAGDCFNAAFLHFWLSGASPQTCPA